MTLFITGTDTGVGKTYVACLIARALRLKDTKVGVMKPVETGCAPDPNAPNANDATGGRARLVPKDALALIEAAQSDQPLDDVNPYRFAAPLSPHAAAEAAGTRIDTAKILAAAARNAERHDVLLVEGAGGLLVPLCDGILTVDLARAIADHVIIVARDALGTINHTLLTLAAARAHGLSVLGVVLDAVEREDLSVETNREAITRFGRVPVLARVGRGERTAPARLIDAVLGARRSP